MAAVDCSPEFAILPRGWDYLDWTIWTRSMVAVEDKPLILCWPNRLGDQLPSLRQLQILDKMLKDDNQMKHMNKSKISHSN